MSIWDSYKNSPYSPFGLADAMTREDPEKEARKYLDQIPGMGHGIYDPYITGGKKAGGILEGEYGKMLDPTSFMNSIMGKYHESENAKYQTDKLGRGINATAAAGGVAGTPGHEQAYGEMAQKIMSGDMQQFLENALGIHSQGVKGEENFYNKGFDASSSLADLLGGALGSQAGLSYQSGNQRNMDRQALMNAITKALSSGAGAGGGGAF